MRIQSSCFVRAPFLCALSPCSFTLDGITADQALGCVAWHVGLQRWPPYAKGQEAQNHTKRRGRQKNDSSWCTQQHETDPGTREK